MESKGTNFIAGRVASGQKTVGDYDYFLFLEVGRKPMHIIMRIKSDNSEIKFCKIPRENDWTIAWASPATQTYIYASEA